MINWKEAACLLCFAQERPQWVNLTLQMDSRGCHLPRFEWVSTKAELIQAVHEKQYDCIILAFEQLQNYQQNVTPLVQAIRTSGCADPVLLLTAQIDSKDLTDCYKTDLEFLHSSLFWDAPALVFALERCIKRHQQQEEHLAWARERKQKLLHDQKESDRLLQQQKSMLQDLKSLTAPATVQHRKPSEERSTDRTKRGRRVFDQQPTEFDLSELDPSEFGGSSHPSEKMGQSRGISSEPITNNVVTNYVTANGEEEAQLSKLKQYYAELLKTYVVMGTGSLTGEIEQLALQVEMCRLSPHLAMQMHLEQVEELVAGLGNRSSRHVMNRADLLILELMMRLAECRRAS